MVKLPRHSADRMHVRTLWKSGLQAGSNDSLAQFHALISSNQRGQRVDTGWLCMTTRQEIVSNADARLDTSQFLGDRGGLPGAFSTNGAATQNFSAFVKMFAHI